MIAFAHFLDDVLHMMQPLLIGTALVLWIVAAIGIFRYAWARSIRVQAQKYFPYIPEPRKGLPRSLMVGFVGFAAIVGGEFAAAELIEHEARMEIAPLLASKVNSVTVNGKPIANADAIFSALRGMHSIMAHHSHPTACYRIELTTESGPLELDPCRDSDDPHEYRVFYPGFRETRLNEIGRTVTDALDRL